MTIVIFSDVIELNIILIYNIIKIDYIERLSNNKFFIKIGYWKNREIYFSGPKNTMSLKPLFGGKKPRRVVEASVVPEGMKGGIFYIRVSTEKQEERGNGLESQKEIILDFAKKNNVHQIGEFYIEIGSGGSTLEKRPILSKAIEMSKKHEAYLITSKLDRLSRKASMVCNMLDDNFNFVTVEYGFQAEGVFIRILAALAQKERELIGERTKLGLKQVDKRYEEDYQRQIAAGVENPVRKRLGIPSVADAPKHISHRRRREGLARTENYIDTMINPAVEAYKKENPGENPTRKQIAEQMNKMGFKTEYGNPWSESIIYHTYKKLPKEPKVKKSKTTKKESKKLEVPDESIKSLDTDISKDINVINDMNISTTD